MDFAANGNGFYIFNLADKLENNHEQMMPCLATRFKEKEIVLEPRPGATDVLDALTAAREDAHFAA